MDTAMFSSSLSSSRTQSCCPLQEDTVPRHQPFHSYPAERISATQEIVDYCFSRLRDRPVDISHIDVATRPPWFNGTYYNYWKARMRIFLQSIDYDMWMVIVDGPHVPQKMLNGQRVPKERDELDESDKRLLKINAKAMNCLYNALDFNEYVRIATCESAKEIWDKLEAIYEGTDRVKEAKISILEHEYVMFKKKPDETISEMFTRFTNIINGLKFLGDVYSNEDKVRKILRALPRTWEYVVTAIEEIRDLSKLSLEELMASLITKEMKDEELKAKKKKSIALKTSTSDDDASDTDEEWAMIAKTYARILKKIEQMESISKEKAYHRRKQQK